MRVDTVHDLASRASSGDAAAFDRLVAREQPRLLAYAHARMGRLVTSRELPADVVQSTFREVLQRADLHGTPGDSTLRGWLFQECQRKIVDKFHYHTAQKRDVRREVASPPPRSSDTRALDILSVYSTFCAPPPSPEPERAIAKVRSALTALSEQDQELVHQRFFALMPYTEIAARSGVSEGTLRVRLYRALQRLRSELVPDGPSTTRDPLP